MAACCVALASTVATTRAAALDPAVAEQLFRQGKELAAQGRPAEACAKFYESQRLDPATGTLLAVAECHDAEGKIATAWAEYIEVRTASEDRRPDRVRIAQLAILRLEPRLPKLMVRLSAGASAAPRLTVALDGAVLGSAALGSDLPVDPGTHLIAAEAPDRERWTTQVRVQEREVQTVTVPPLAMVGRAAAATAAVPSAGTTPPPPRGTPGAQTAPARAPSGPGWEMVLGIALGGAGIVSLGVGGIYGLRAASSWSDFKKLCPSPICADAAARGPYDDARSAATLSNVFLGLGAASVAAGAVLFYLGGPSAASPQIGPGAVSRSGATVVARAAW
jgi:hypothetical protein